jgi:hypothetical protein
MRLAKAVSYRPVAGSLREFTREDETTGYCYRFSITRLDEKETNEAKTDRFPSTPGQVSFVKVNMAAGSARDLINGSSEFALARSLPAYSPLPFTSRY